MRKKPTVSIGIPAYNEEENIGNLLVSLLAQKETNFKLQEIIVVSDGSTDKTVKITKSVKSPLIKVIESKKRLGQQVRQNQLISIFKGDILAIIEADTLPYDLNTLNNLVIPFVSNESHTLGMVVGMAISLPAETLVEKIKSHGSVIKNHLFSEWRNGDNFYFVVGHAMKALSRNFTSKLIWPADVPEDAYTYLRLKQLGLQMIKKPNAKAYVKKAANLKDSIRRNKKFVGGIESLKKYFPEDVIKREFFPPLKLKTKHVLIEIVNSPLLTILYLLQLSVIRIANIRVKEFDPLYQPFDSTKNLFSYKQGFVAIAQNHLKSIKPTVTVGIPAYNEEANIRNLLVSLLAQKETNFRLQEIIVVSDGSTDNTVREARKVNDNRIILIEGRKRFGQALRQNQIFDKASGDFLALLNADVLLEGDNFLSRMIEAYQKDKNIDIVGAKTVPLPSDTFIGNILEWQKTWKRQIYEHINGADNIYLCHGRARGFSRKAYSKIRWPQIWSEDAYSYRIAKKLGLRFVYCKQAVVHYQPPKNLKDQVRQSVRFLSAPKALAPYFSKEELKTAYTIPRKLFITSMLKGFIKNPLKATAYLAIYSYCKILATTTKPKNDNHLWERLVSTKTLRGNSSYLG